MHMATLEAQSNAQLIQEISFVTPFTSSALPNGGLTSHH